MKSVSLLPLLSFDSREEDASREEGYKDQQWMYDHPKLSAIRDWFWDMLARILAVTICKWFGCNIHMDGYADGDTGYEDWYCTRCGRGGHHIYY